MKKDVIRSILTAFASGDALGMPTEFMTRKAIKAKFGLVDAIIDPQFSQNHAGLRRASVTDDTEQVLALLDEYCRAGCVEAHGTAARLLRWMRESGAVEKGYIGPSSKSALEAIEKGASILEAGSRGTTCGGIMRSPAAIIFALARNLPLDDCVYICLMPTHRTQRALEAALAYSYTMRWALTTGPGASPMGSDAMTKGSGVLQRCEDFGMAGPARREEAARIAGALKESSLEACDAASRFVPEAFCGSTVPARIACFEAMLPALSGPDAVLDFLYDVFGTGLDSIDVAAAVLCIFRYCGPDTWLALRMGASVGGDTDTIAALAGGLSAAYATSQGRPLNIPPRIAEEVVAVNSLEIDQLSDRLGA